MQTLTLDKISFPVYLLGRKPDKVGTQQKYTKQYVENDITHLVDLVVDDTSIEAETLGARRAQLKQKGVRLFNIKTSVYFIGDLVKLAKSGVWFIDTEGQIFEYKKSSIVPLIFRPITSIKKMQTGGAIIEVQGVPSRFKTLYTPQPEQKFAGVLVVGVSYVLYGFYDQQYDRTTRHI